MSTFDERRTPEQAWEFVRAVHRDWDKAGLPMPHVMGSMRRFGFAEGAGPVIGDLDLIVVPQAEPDLFGEGLEPTLVGMGLPDYLKVTTKKAFGWREIDGHGRMMVDAWLCPPESVGPFALFLTGPPGLNIVMRQITQAVGLMLTQYGLFEPKPKPTKTYPNRVVPGRRIDVSVKGEPVVAEQMFWQQWCEAVGLERRYPLPIQREEVTRWLQGQRPGTRSAATSRD